MKIEDIEEISDFFNTSLLLVSIGDTENPIPSYYSEQQQEAITSSIVESAIESFAPTGTGAVMRSDVGEEGENGSYGYCIGNFVYPFGLAFKTVENVLCGKQWIPWNGNCYDAATEQTIVGGGDPSGPLEALQIMIDNVYQKANDKDQLTLNRDEGYMTIINELSSGKPVMLGVAYHDGFVDNHNALTDHYIVAVGLGYDNTRKQNYITYYDNYGDHLTNLVINRLYFDKNGISGIGYSKDGVTYFYQVTEVRPNSGRKSFYQFWK